MALQKMTNLDYYFLVGELRALEGSHLNQVYELSKGLFRLKFRGEKEYNLIAELGLRAHFTKYIPQSPEQASGFTMMLRKNLSNARTIEADQKNFDRLILLSFEKNDGIFHVVLEQFARGNLILCDGEFIIIQPYKSEESKARSLKKYASYAPPVSRPTPSENTGLPQLEGKLVPALSKATNLPTLYVQEILLRLAIDETTPTDQIKLEQLQKIMEEGKAIEKMAADPRVYYENGKPVAFSAFPLQKFAHLESKPFPTFSEALDEYYQNASREETGNNGQPGAAVKAKADNQKLKKLEHTLAEQEGALKRLATEEAEAKQKAEAIYSNFEKVEDALKHAKSEGKKGKIELEV